MKNITKLKTIRQQEQQAIEDLKTEILSHINTAYVKEIEAKLDESKELTSTEYDEYFSTWVRFDQSKLADIDFNDSDQVDALKDVLNEHDCLTLDLKNDCITRSIGPCIVINEHGEVLDQDSGKRILKTKDFDSEDDLHAAIENHMEKTGHFPSVVRCDRYNNAFFVNTLSRANQTKGDLK